MTMGEIRSAREIALEKAEKLGKATKEELDRAKYIPEGEKLANNYLRNETNLVAELTKYPEGVRRYLVAGAQDVLVRNLDLPKGDFIKKRNKMVLAGLKVLKQDKAGLENVFSKIRRLFEHYEGQGEQQRKQAYEMFKRDFEARVRQAMQQQGVIGAGRLDVERHPQFQDEWRQNMRQLDSQYLKLLEEYRQEILSTS
jgi:hypothetical protein